MSNQLLDVVNNHDEVIKQVTFSEVLKNDLIIRVAHVWVVNSKGEFLIQTARRETTPCHCDASTGGKVLPGEEYETTAARKVAEELGLKDAKLEAGSKYFFDTPGLRMFVQVFLTRTDAPFTQEHLKWFSIPELEAEIKRKPYMFVPNMLDSINAVRNLV